MMRTVAPVDEAALAAMPTRQLLARLRRLLECEESPESSDWSDDAPAAARDSIAFNSDPRWADAYGAAKRVLATREHLPSAADRAARRIERATRGGRAGRKDRGRPS